MRCLRARDERGSVSALVVLLAVALMIMAGLVVDGGNAINARQRAIDDAGHAARVGANQIDVAALRALGQVVILWPQAGDAARNYLTTRGYDPDEIHVGPSPGGGVRVTVNVTADTQLLSLVGVGTFTVNGQATSRPAVGILQEIP